MHCLRQLTLCLHYFYVKIAKSLRASGRCRNPARCRQQDHATSYGSSTPFAWARPPLQPRHRMTSVVPLLYHGAKFLLTNDHCQQRESYQSPEWN